MIPFMELTQGGKALDFKKVDKLKVDFPLRDWRQSLYLTAELALDPSEPLMVYGGYYPFGKTLLFEGILTKRKAADEYVFHTALPESFAKRTYMDTTPQAVLKTEFEAFGLDCDFQEAAVRHEVILSGGVYKRVRELAEKETPYRCWWISPEKNAWWGKVEESQRYNAEPIWLDTRRDIIKIDARAKAVKTAFMPWIRGGCCLIMDDPVDKQELVQTVVFNATHSFERERGFFTTIGYL